MGIVRTLWSFAVTGALLGVVVTGFLYPGMYAWYQAPGSGLNQELLHRVTIIQETTDALIRAQLIGAAIGAAVCLILGILWVRSSARRARERAARTQATGTNVTGGPPATAGI